jgi:hypothetical protein
VKGVELTSDASESEHLEGNILRIKAQGIRRNQRRLIRQRILKTKGKKGKASKNKKSKGKKKKGRSKKKSK